MERDSERSTFVEAFFQIHNGLTEIEEGFARFPSFLVKKVNDACLVDNEIRLLALSVWDHAEG